MLYFWLGISNVLFTDEKEKPRNTLIYSDIWDKQIGI